MSSSEPSAASGAHHWPLCRLVGVASYAVAAILLLLGYIVIVDSDEEREVLAYFVVMAVLAVLAYWLFERLAPRDLEAADAARPARHALALGVLTVVSAVVFWTGLGLIMGPAGVLIGHYAHARGERLGTIGLGLAALGLAANLVIILSDFF